MKKRLLAIMISLVMIVGALAGCGNNSAPPPSGGETQPIVLKVNNFAPAALPFGVGMDYAAEYIMRESGGEIVVEVYHDGTLLGFNDTYQGVRQGVADIGIVGPAATDSVVMLNSVFTTMQKYLPSNTHNVTAACYELITTVPEIQAEMESVGVRWLGCYALFGSSIHARGIQPLTPSDMKGVGIEALGGVSGYFAQMGANALSLDPADYYLSMERGVIQAMAVHWPGLDGYKIIELVDNHIMFGEDGGGIFFGMMGYIINADTWNGLSTEHQRIVWDGFKAGSALTIDLDGPSAERAINYAIENGHEFVYLTTDAELAPWFEHIDQFNAEWVERVSAAGFPAQSTLEKLQELLAKY